MSQHRTSVTTLAVAAIGVVFGDIGTSPLYALKESLHVSGTDRDSVLGVISLVFWALMLVVSLKYLAVVMRADNKGEGGILALLALLPQSVRRATGGARLALLLLILLGTALLFGDGALTPAISVLSATEGIGLINEDIGHYAVPLTVVILAGLFAVQSRGTHRIGAIFGPVMLVWFVTLAGLGLWRASSDWGVFAALLPNYAIGYLLSNTGLALAIGAVVILAVTGAEALYADMGHFGLKPIRLGWIALVAPSLVLCYLGQAAVVLADPAKAKDPFYSLSPNPTFTFFLVILATLATVIASQALITGVFSLSRQAVQLGLLPRMTIRHTNEEHEGQIYVPLANWMLGIASIALVIGFGSSSALAAAYVLAIAGTMGVTTVAFYAVATYVWGWSRARVVPLTALFLLIDGAFLASTATKFVHGGWVPVAIALVILLLMLVWRRGHRVLAAYVAKSDTTWPRVLDALERREYARTPGEAMVLASHPDQVPTALASTIRLVHAVPEQVTVVTVNTLPIPYADPENRLMVTELGFGVRQVTVDVGFTETPSLPALLAPLGEESADRVYYLSDRVFVASDDGEMGRFSESVFAFMHRNAVRPAPFYGLPEDRVVTLSSHVDL